MLPLKLLIAWYAWFQTTSSLLSPAIFLALANIQNQRAKATLNALNWRAKNQYNLALAKSRAKLPATRNFNSPAFGNSNLLPTFGNSNLLPALKNSLLVRTTRETSPDKDVTPVAEKVFLGGHDFGDVGKMDMLVPVEQDDVFSSEESPEAPHSSATGRSVELEAHLHLHKPHHHHHHHKDIFYHGDINHHINAPPIPHQSPFPQAILPEIPQNFHSQAIHDNHLPPRPSFSSAYPPPHLPLPTLHPPVQQHQSINLNVVQNQRIGSRNRVQPSHDGSGHRTDGAGVDLVDHNGFSGHVGEEVLRNGGEKDALVNSKHVTLDVYGKKPEGIEDKTVGIFHQVQSDSSDFPPYQDPRLFDPSQPENRQDIAKYIKDEQQNIGRIVQTLNKNNYHYNAPRYSWQYSYPSDEDEYDGLGGDASSRSSGEGQRERSGRDRIGSINTAELNQFPITLPEMEQTLPDVLHGVFDQPRSVEYRQEIIADYLETEQKNVQMAMEELQKAHQRNVEILLKNLDEDVSPQPDPIRERPLGVRNSYTENDADLGNYEIPTEHLQNEPGTKSITDISPLVGHIIQVPERRYSDDYYQRRVRSIGGNATRSLEEALDTQRNLLKAMKRHTKHDEDLMMIEQIGKSIIDDIEGRVEKNRVKRGAMKKDVLRLVTDPNEKFDMPKTLENLGSVARSAFEDKHAPMFHLRNMVGSTRDAVMATMKIPNQQFLVPRQYEITHTGRGDLLGDINPNIFSTPSTSGQKNVQSGQMVDGVTNTFQKVGSVIRDSVESGKEALFHVGDAANHAKNAIKSTKHMVPRVIFKTVPNILRQSRKKTMIFTPRIFDFSQEDQQLQNSVGSQQENFVTAGEILEAVGVSEPHRSLKYEKITIEPRQNFLDQDEMTSSSSPNSPNLFDKIEVEDVDDIEHDPDLVGSTLDNLQQVQQSFGTNSLKDFILRMKNEVETLMKTARKKTLGWNNESYDSFNRRRNNFAPALSNRLQPTLASPSTNRDETVGYSFIPMDLRRPFMDQAGAKSARQFARRRSTRVGANNENAAPIVGAINPLVYERMFNERLQDGHSSDNLRKGFAGQLGGTNGGECSSEGDRPVATSMKIQGQFLKPFMGQATKKNIKDFFGLYNTNADKKKHDSEYSDVDQEYDYIELQSVENQ